MFTDTYLIAETDRRQREREAKSRQLAAFAAAVIEPRRDPRAISEPDAQHPHMYANTARAYAAGELCEKQKPRGLGVAMARKAKFSVAPSDARFNRGHTDPARGFSWVDPEEGYRLMGAFLSIKQPTLREAAVKMVTELSIPDDERRTLVKSISIRSSIYFCPETKTPRGVFL